MKQVLAAPVMLETSEITHISRYNKRSKVHIGVRGRRIQVISYSCFGSVRASLSLSRAEAEKIVAAFRAGKTMENEITNKRGLRFRIRHVDHTRTGKVHEMEAKYAHTDNWGSHSVTLSPSRVQLLIDALERCIQHLNVTARPAR